MNDLIFCYWSVPAASYQAIFDQNIWNRKILKFSKRKKWKLPLKNLKKSKVIYILKIVLLNFQNGRASSESSEDGAGSSASTSRGTGSYGSGCAGGWRSVFGAVSGRELRLYECAPWSPEAWASPSITCPLIATRSVLLLLSLLHPFIFIKCVGLCGSKLKWTLCILTGMNEQRVNKKKNLRF